MTEVRVDQINVIAELERIGWGFTNAGPEEVCVKCPAHADESPSCYINVEKRLFQCKASQCGVSGDIVTFLSLALKTIRTVMIQELSSRYALETSAAVDLEVVERYHSQLKFAGPLLNELYKRGLSDETLRERRIGFDNGRIMIPIFAENGACVNIRKYLPGAPGSQKMKNLRGHGEIRLYPLDQLKYDTIVLTGGECKALVGAQHMNPHGIGFVTATCGEGNWDPKLNLYLRGKRVYICMDVDKAGKVAATGDEKRQNVRGKSATGIASRIRAEVAWLGIINLPLDAEKYPKGDLNDYFGPEKMSAPDFLALMASVQEWVPSSLQPGDNESVEESAAKRIHLSQITTMASVGERVEVVATVAALDTAPYLVPRRVRATCSRKEHACDFCPVFAVPEPEDSAGVELTIKPHNPFIMDMIGASSKFLRDAIRQSLGIPSCKSVQFDAKDHYNVEEADLTPQLAISSRDRDAVRQSAYVIGRGLEANESYVFDGRIYPHPRTQQARLLASAYAPVQDALSQFAPSDDELRELQIFQPNEHSVDALKDKLDHIYSDFEANVTRIWFRRDLHRTVDLIYHTPLLITLDGRTVKGWGEALIIGDTSQGKSEASSRLMDHYGLGERVECKSATVAGLLGGVDTIGQRYVISWGVIPTHDKRLVILEELKGAPVEVFSKLTDMRSSGVAEIAKIAKRRTHARTRLIAISNPRSSKSISAYNFGIEAVRELIGSPEDIRRFDIALILARSQVDPVKLNQFVEARPTVKHTYTSQLCRRLILWGWTRNEKEVIFTEEARKRVLSASSTLCSKFSEEVPLVDPGSMRYKLGRLAAALAIRTFSCSDDLKSCIVRPCHVDYVYDMFDRIYSDPVFGYVDFSQAMKISDTMQDRGVVEKSIIASPYPRDLVEQLLSTDSIELRDICDWCGWDREPGLEMLSLFVRKRAMVRVDRGYRKTPKFIEMLREMREGGKLPQSNKPDFMQGRSEIM